MIGTKINDRYRIDSKVGEGGMGTVYRGYDTTLEREVAIKMLTGSRLGTEGRNRLLQEAKAIAQLSHPNIITVYDAGEYEKSPFIVMEYVQGVSLYDQPPEEIQEIVAIMQQLCAALAHAHGHGIIHRDLKPENVILTADGTAKLMDFGLARSISSRITSEGTIMGTVFYLAPEQAQGRAVDQRSDLYSFGVMLYELLAGELPFTADNPLAVISQHIHAPLVPPRAKNGQISPALEALILEMMNKDPKDRPASALEVLQRLSAPEMLDVTALPVAELSVLDRIVRGRLVGRKTELYQARRMWQQAIAGKGQLLLISGEPGVGKTRLMREIVTQAEVSGGQAYIGENQAEGNAPYAAFAHIIRRAMRAHQKNGLELPNLVMAELISIAPNLQVDYPDIPPNPPLEPESEQLRLFECVIRFFSTICEESPLLLVLEDIHWGDSGTLSLLEFLARRCQEHPVMLLGTCREVELDEAMPFHQTLLELNRKNLGTHLKLERLDENETRELLAVIFAEGITPDFLEGIFKQTEGNPFFIEEVCKALIESGQLYFDGEIWHRPPEMADMEIPQSVKVAVQSRVSKLSGSAQEILRNAAVIGREFDFELLRKVAEKQEDDLINSLETVLKAQLIEELRESDGERFSFSHALIPTTLRESLSGMRRKRLHLKVAQVMEEVFPDAYQRLAYHWGESGNVEKWLDYTLKAADRAKETYANEDAVRLYGKALSFFAEDDEKRFDLLNARAEIFNLIGNREAQRVEIEAMLALAEKQVDNVKLVDALHALVKLNLETDVHKALKPAQRAHEISKNLGDLPRQARSAHLIGRSYAVNLDHNRAIPHLKEAIQIARTAGLNHELVGYLDQLSRCQWNLGLRDDSMRSAQETACLSDRVNDERIKLIGTINLGAAYLAAKNREAGLPVIQNAVSLAREIGDLERELGALNILGIILTGMERLEEAADVYLQMINKFDLFQFFRPYNAVINIEYVYKAMGEYEKFHRLVLDLLEKANQAENHNWVVRLTFLFVSSCFRFGLNQEALKRLETALPYAEELENQVYMITYLKYLGLFSALVGDFDSAYSCLQSAQAQSERLEESVVTTDVWNISAYVALIDGNPSALPVGIEQANKGIAMFETFSHDVDWEYFFILAGLHLASGHEAEAHAALEKALAIQEDEVLVDLITPEMLYSYASKVFRANHQPEKADEYLRKAYDRIMLVAGKIQDDDLRQDYLGAVKDYQEIIKEAEARGW